MNMNATNVNALAMGMAMSGMATGGVNGHCGHYNPGQAAFATIAAMNMMQNMMAPPSKTSEQLQREAEAELVKKEAERKAAHATGFAGVPASVLKKEEDAAATNPGPSLQLQREIEAIKAQRARDEEREAAERMAREEEAAAAATAKTSGGWFGWLKKGREDTRYQPMKVD